jgi:hypothetical protein
LLPHSNARRECAAPGKDLYTAVRQWILAKSERVDRFAGNLKYYDEDLDGTGTPDPSTNFRRELPDD